MANNTDNMIYMKLFVMFCSVLGFAITLDFDGISEYQAIAGGKISLPCNTTIWSEDDISLVIWYRGNSGIPIYTVDARSSPLSKSKHVVADELSGRANMDTALNPPVLNVDQVLDSDEGDYRCRVDYRKHRTQHFLVHLNITVPPKDVIIKNINGEKLSGVIGPYDEDQSLMLVCDAIGGKPPPSVLWTRNGGIIDSTYVTALHDTDTHGQMMIVKNELRLTKLTKKDLLTELECVAQNSNITVPLKKSVTVDLNLRPSDVSIITPNRPLSSGHHTDIQCRSFGSRPNAQISWWKGSKKMPKVHDRSSDGNATISTLSFIPVNDDNGKHLSCRAENVQMPDSAIEDGRILTVHYLPQPTLVWGANIRDTIREGNDVYFECLVTANPWISDLSWLFEGKPLNTDPSSGIIVSNQSLVLQKVRREHRGEYQCAATNTEGQGTSNKLNLKVYFAPVCKPGQTIIYGVARNEQVNVTCDVEAEPNDHVKFKWMLNNTAESFDIRTFVSNRGQSNATYVPKTRAAYGVLLCWAENSIGKQKDPCTFSIVAAGPPNPVHDCTVPNITMTALLIECQSGDNGGLRQIFHLEVYNVAKELLHSNLTSFDIPVFLVDNLPPATDFTLNLFASNAKGRSDSVTMSISTSPSPEKHARKDGFTEIEMSPIIGVLIGVVASLVLVCVVAVIVIKLKVDRFDDDDKEETELQSKSNTPQHANDSCATDSHMNLISVKQDSLGFTNLHIDTKFNNDNTQEFINTCHIVSDHRQSDYTHAPVLYKCPAPDVTYAELSLVPTGINANHQRVIVRRPIQHEPTEYAQIDFQRSVIGCPQTNQILQNRESPVADGCSENEVTLETPLVNCIGIGQQKYMNQEAIKSGIHHLQHNSNQTPYNSATPV